MAPESTVWDINEPRVSSVGASDDWESFGTSHSMLSVIINCFLLTCRLLAHVGVWPVQLPCAGPGRHYIYWCHRLMTHRQPAESRWIAKMRSFICHCHTRRMRRMSGAEAAAVHVLAELMEIMAI